MSLVSTPNVKTISEVSQFLNLEPYKLVKTLIYNVDNHYVACLVLGNREVNETKVKKLYQANDICLADNETVFQLTNAPVGFAGPIGLDIDIIVDNEVATMTNFVVGANQSDHHYINVNLNDFKYNKIADIRNIMEHDTCCNCGGHIYFKKGIEIGNTFKLGTKYSDALNLNYADQNNQLHPVVMGSYGIGTARLMAAIVEQNNTENSIHWPINVAPFEIAIVLINEKDPQQQQVANDLYESLLALKVDVVLDNRDERAGVKFKDMELIGVPYRITVGKAVLENNIEFKMINDDKNQIISIDKIIDHVRLLLNK